MVDAALQDGECLSVGLPSFPPALCSQPLLRSSSVVHRAVTSRPGALPGSVYNFGFSGNGLMELGVGEWLTQIDASIIVLDCIWNMQPALIANNTVPLVHQLRKAHPDTPIVLAEDTEAGQAWIQSGSRSLQAQKRAALTAGYNALVAGGDTNLHYVPADRLYQFANLTAVDPDHLISPTVGGCHPSDLGQMAVATFYSSFLPTLLGRDAGHPATSVGVDPAAWPRGRGASVTEAAGHNAELARLQPQELRGREADAFVFTDIESSDL